jgi:hypothetical protein
MAVQAEESMERDYWPESPLFAVEAQGCTHHPYRRQRGVLPEIYPRIYVSRYEASVMALSRNDSQDEAPARPPKPYLEAPI